MTSNLSAKCLLQTLQLVKFALQIPKYQYQYFKRLCLFLHQCKAQPNKTATILQLFNALSTDTSCINIGVCCQELLSPKFNFHYWYSRHSIILIFYMLPPVYLVNVCMQCCIHTHPLDMCLELGSFCTNIMLLHVYNVHKQLNISPLNSI